MIWAKPRPNPQLLAEGGGGGGAPNVDHWLLVWQLQVWRPATDVLPRLYCDADGRTFLPANFHVRKHGDADDVQTIQHKKSPGDGYGLDRLIDRPGADCLNLGTTSLADNTSNGIRSPRLT